MAEESRLDAWRDPALAEHFAPRDARDPLCVRLGPDETARMWDEYKRARQRAAWPYILLTHAGGVAGTAEDWNDAVTLASDFQLCVYNFARRRCSRPIWYCPFEERELTNRAMETVCLYGYKSFMIGWESRPRVKLFAND